MTLAVISQEDLKQLAEHHQEPSVSLYLPTHRRSRETNQDPIRLKNLLSAARTELEELGHRPADTDQLLAPGDALLDDSEFWQHQTDGLALLLSDDTQRVLQLPVAVPELSVVSTRFHISPLVEALPRARFLILALSRGHMRLFEATRRGISQLEVDAPTSIEDTSWFTDREAQLQHHVSGWQGEPGTGEFHGHDPSQWESEDLRRYLAAVAAAVHEEAKDSSAPVVLAATEEMAAAYRQQADHDVAPQLISGSPEDLGEGRVNQRVHQEALEVVAEHLDRIEQEAITRLHNALGQGRATTGTDQVLEAAEAGRVDETLVRAGTQRWGRWDPDQMNATVHDERQPGDEDLHDRAIATTLHFGGTAWIVDDTGEEADVAAILRF